MRRRDAEQQQRAERRLQQQGGTEVGPDRRGTRGEQLPGGQIDDPLDPGRQLRIPLGTQRELHLVGRVQGALRQVPVQLDLDEPVGGVAQPQWGDQELGPLLQLLEAAPAAPAAAGEQRADQQHQQPDQHGRGEHRDQQRLVHPHLAG